MPQQIDTRNALRNIVIAVAMCSSGIGVRAAAGMQQDPPPPEQVTTAGALSGRVVAMGSNDPLGLASVTLLPQPAGVLPANILTSSFLAGSRTVLTDDLGSYRFPRITPGSYRLYVRRIGYRPAILDIDLEGSDGLQLSVGLTVAPIRLEPVTAITDPADQFSADDAARVAPVWDRVTRERWRQDTFLESDVRAISHDDVVEAITFGEIDIFRALQRLPGVSTRDDWTAELWVRGAPGSQTRTYFDGMPLYNPYHAGGLLSAINTDGLGAVFLHPGVRSVQMGGGAAAVVDMKSRPAAGLGEVHGRLNLLRSHVGAEVERRWLDGRVGTLVAVRRSWFGRTRDLVQTGAGVSPEIPTNYADAIGRVDIDLGNGRSLEFSGLWEHDWIDGFIAGGPAGNTASWGNAAGRGTAQVPAFGGSFRQTLGFSLFEASVRQIHPHLPLAAYDSLPTQEPTDNEVSYVALTGVWARPDETALGAKWRAGYNLTHQRVKYLGAPPAPHSVQTYLFTADIDGSVTSLRLWGERVFRPSDRLAIKAGVRFEVDRQAITNLLDEDRVVLTDGQISPQLSLRYAATDRMNLTMAKGSHLQYEQAVAPSGLSFGPALTVAPLWILAPNTRSAVKTEITTVGWEHWLTDEWLASANYYHRTTSGLAIPDPRPGTTDDDRFSVPAHNQAKGIELGVRRLAGRWTGSFGYTLSASDLHSDGLKFPAPADRRHIVNANAMVRISDRVGQGSLRIGGTFTSMSGAPFTRIHPGWYDCSEYEPEGYCTAIVPNQIELPNAERSPWYTATNVLIEWSRSFRGWDLGAHAQVQNLLNAPLAVTYAVDDQGCRRRRTDSPFCGSAEDRFIPGLRRSYELGLKLAF